MLANNPEVSCSFGKATIDKPATATAEGRIFVHPIETVLALIGNKGTVVLVDKTSGVNQTKEITFAAAATPTTAELVGAYEVNSATIQDIADGDTIENYELLFTAKDQYGSDVYASDFTKNVTAASDGVNASLAGGLTNLHIKGGDITDGSRWSERVVNGVEYIALPLSGGKATAGDATLTIVNPAKGLVLTTSVTVVKSAIIKSLTVTADNGVYAEQANVMAFEAIDSNGNNVKDYNILKRALSLPAPGYAAPQAPEAGMWLEKNADGTAKLMYYPVSTPSDKTGKASTIEAVTIYANKPTSGDYLVVPVTFTVNQKRYPVSVLGMASDAETAISKDTAELKLDPKKLILGDQYSNKIVNGEKIFTTAVSTGAITGGAAVWVDCGNRNSFDGFTISGGAIVVSRAALGKVQPGTATVYFKYNAANAEELKGVSKDQYDAKVTISVYDTTLAANVEIESINSGYAYEVTSISFAN